MRVLLLCCLAFICGRCVASVTDTDSVTPKRSWLGKFDAFLEKQQAAARFDTAYMMRPDTRWMLKLRLNVSFHVKGQIGMLGHAMAGTTGYLRIYSDRII